MTGRDGQIQARFNGEDLEFRHRGSDVGEFLGLRGNIVYFRTVSEAVKSRQSEGTHRFRLAGAVVTGSIAQTARGVRFDVTDGKQTVTVDLKLRHSFDWGKLALSVNNLFGEHYYTYAVRSAFTADRYAVYPLAGRTVGLTAEFKLDW